MSLLFGENGFQNMTGSTFDAGSKSEQNFYELLGVDSSDSKVKIREVYIRLKKAYSNTSQALYSLMDDESAKQMLTQIEEAFHTLDDEGLRKKYDEKLRRGSQTKINEPSSNRPGGLGAGGVKNDIFDSPAESGPGFQVDDVDMTHSGSESSLKNYPKLRRAVDLVQDSDISNKIRELSIRGMEGDGAVYRQIREMMGVSLEHAHSQTRVIVKYLVAIEENDYSALPAPVYVRGFIRSYLLFLGVENLDGSVNRYLEKYTNWTRKSAK